MQHQEASDSFPAEDEVVGSQSLLFPTPGGSPRVADSYPVEIVEISALLLDGSPRLKGENTAHASILAENGAMLPPILVHRSTMRVIDGIHRVLAAQIKGATTIAAQFYEGSAEAAFVLAVKQNVAHGLPLSLADRKAAAGRIISSHLNLSDRAIAASTGLSDRTVRTIRHRSTAEAPQLNDEAEPSERVERIGRDGRSRPMNNAERRHRASQIIAEQPAVTLRTVAKAAGVSLATAHDVRSRMRRGIDPVLTKHRVTAPSPTAAPQREVSRSATATSNQNFHPMLESLRKDPSLKFTDAGRCLLRWLGSHAIEPKDWEPLLENVPAHCTKIIAELARSSADAWQEFARELAMRNNTSNSADASASLETSREQQIGGADL